MNSSPEINEEIDIEEKSLDFVNNCSWFLMRKVVRLLTNHLNYLLKDTGILSTQLGTLAILAINDQLSVSEIAKELVMDQTTATRNILSLQKENLIESVEGPDKRVKLMSLTDLGRKKISKALPIWEYNQNKIVETLGINKIDDLTETLSKILLMLNSKPKA